MTSNASLPTQRELQTYLAKIGFTGDPRPDLATLRAVNRLHMLTFPYENIDVQFGRRLTRDPRAAFAKLVEQDRGGWCYEYNGLFAWMLEGLGFRVRRLAGGVMREAAGDKMVGNHLVPIVELDRLYLADPSMAIIDPLPLEEGPIRQGFLEFALSRSADGWWRFRNHPGALPPSFDFSLDVTDPALMDHVCGLLQTDPSSPFVRNAILQHYAADRIDYLVGRTHTVITAKGIQTNDADSAEAYARAARDHFGLTIPDLPALWAKISEAPATGFLAGVDEAAI